MAEQTSRLAIILDSTGAKRNSDTLATSLERLTVQGEKATESTDGLNFSFKRLATTAAGAMSISMVIGAVDNYGQMAARMKNALKSVTGDIKDFSDIQERFLAISNRNGKAIETTQELYIGTATAMKELGYNTSQTVDYIESMSSAFTANATSAMATESALNAIQKANIEGRVSGQNWNAIMNATPTILNDIAKELERTNGGMKVTETQVKKLAADGKISFKLFADAVMNAKNANNELADSMDNTKDDGLTRVANSAKVYYGEMNQALGITRAISAGLADVSNNFDTVATGLTAVVGIGAARYFGNLSTSIYDTTKKTAENALATRKLAGDKVNAAKAALTQAQTEKAAAISGINATKAQQAAATTEVQRISLKTQLANQTAVLTAATKAETVATTELAAAQGKLSLANNLVKGGLALVGGPVGLAMLAAGGMYSFASSMQQAKEDAIALSRGLDGLLVKLKEMTREQKLLRIGELEESFDALESAARHAQIAFTDGQFARELNKSKRALDAAKVGTKEYAEALKEFENTSKNYEVALAKKTQAENDLSRAQNTAKVIQADLNGTLQQGADLLRAHTQTTLPNGAAAFKSFGFDVNTAANALGKFNAASLQINFSDGGARLKKQLERDLALAKKTGEERARLQAKYAAEDAGETDERAIGNLQDLAALVYSQNEAQKKLTKSQNSTYSESAAQKMLSSLKEQQMVLIQQSTTNEKLGSQAQALVKWQQEIKDIEEKKAKGKLTAEQKSLLASKALITKELERNVQLEQAIKNREAEVKIAAYNKQLMEETAQAQRAYNIELQGAGMGTFARGRLQEELRLKEEYLKKQEALTAQFNDKSTGITQEMYDAETQIIKTELDKRLVMMRVHQSQMDGIRMDWSNGIEEGLRNYVDNARNYNQQAEGFITGSLQNITDGSADALTDIVTNSKNAFDAIGDFFGDLSKSIIKDLIRIAIQAQITNAVSGLFGGGIMGSSQVKTFNAGLNGLNLTGMAHSGIDRVPETGTWLLEKGERVMTQDTSARLDSLLAEFANGTHPDQYAMKYLHPANQTNNTTNNSNVNNNAETNESTQSSVVIHQTVNQTITVTGNGDKTLEKVVQIAIDKGSKKAIAEIQRDFATNGKTRKILER